MSRTKESVYSVGRLRRWQLTATPESLAKTASTVFGVVMLFAAAIPIIAARNQDQTRRYHDLLLTVCITIVGTLLATVIYYILVLRLYRYQVRKRTEYLGLSLSGDDRIAVYLWYRYQLKPQESHLRPFLQKYIDYVAALQGGDMKLLIPYRLITSVWVIFSLLSIESVIMSVNAILKHRFYFFDIYSLTVSIFVLAFYSTAWWSSKTGRHNKLWIRINTRGQKRIRLMQDQLLSE